VKPDLDDLFALPSAAITLEAGMGLKPTGVGSVCVKPAEGGGFAGLREQIDELLKADNNKYSENTDSFGFSWITREGDLDLSDLVTDLHSVNASLADAGFGPALLCTLVVFSGDGGAPVGLVYLYKRGTWYPFVPTGKDKRDNARELQVRAVLGSDLKVESDLSRWFPVWGAPGL
jgi:PspAB-like protein